MALTWVSGLALTRAIRSGEHLSIALPLPDPESARVLGVPTNSEAEQRDSSTKTTIQRFSIRRRYILISPTKQKIHSRQLELVAPEKAWAKTGAASSGTPTAISVTT